MVVSANVHANSVQTCRDAYEMRHHSFLYIYPQSRLITLARMYVKQQVRHRACLCSACVFVLSFWEVLEILK